MHRDYTTASGSTSSSSSQSLSVPELPYCSLVDCKRHVFSSQSLSLSVISGKILTRTYFRKSWHNLENQKLAFLIKQVQFLQMLRPRLFFTAVQQVALIEWAVKLEIPVPKVALDFNYSSSFCFINSQKFKVGFIFRAYSRAQVIQLAFQKGNSQKMCAKKILLQVKKVLCAKEYSVNRGKPYHQITASPYLQV